MKILEVTGRLAEYDVKKVVKDPADVLVVDINIAAFIKPKLLKRSLYSFKTYTSYDLILIPGLIPADFSDLEKELGVKIRLGPRDAQDLDFVLSYSAELNFSKTIPACELLTLKLQAEAHDKLQSIEKASDYAFKIRDLKIGGGVMKVMVEIVDATRMSEEELTKRINDFKEKGADIIDLGLALDATVKEVQRTVETAKFADVPIGIDTKNPELIKSAIDKGIDLVLNLDSNIIKEVGKYIAFNEVPAVVIPDLKSELLAARSDMSRLTPYTSTLKSNIELAKSLGIVVIANPTLNPIGSDFTGSICRYYEFRQQDKETPLFLGVRNITELIDADSVGVNAMLAGIGMEIGVSILFTSEYSNKTVGGINELKTAAQMMLLARQRNCAPKDIGIDLLRLKEKRRHREIKIPVNDIPHLHATQNEKWTVDPAGCFKIGITESKEIVAIHEIRKHRSTVIIGNTAKEVLDTILREGLVTRLDHVGYLGRELMKAELALKFGRSYAQDAAAIYGGRS